MEKEVITCPNQVCRTREGNISGTEVGCPQRRGGERKGRKENLQGNESARSLIYGRMNNIGKKRAINQKANHAWNNESSRCNTSSMSLRYSDALRRNNFICNSQNTQWQKANTRRIKCPKGATQITLICNREEALHTGILEHNHPWSCNTLEIINGANSTRDPQIMQFTLPDTVPHRLTTHSISQNVL